MSGACDDCLRRAYLLGRLAPYITGLLGRRQRPPAGLLTLSEERLIAGVCGSGERADDARRFLEGFEPAAARETLAEHVVEATCRHDAAYPRVLLDLDDPPAVLFVAGGLDRLCELTDAPMVTIVGARRGSPHGLEVASALGRGLAAAGLTVVSGLALGIDAAAHRGACAAPAGGALAVVARGPEQCYPLRNGALYREILGGRGCVVAELPPGTPVFRWAFPARNRIMAALAQLTIVVEAAEPSGSLITAEFAAQLHRSVGAVPGRVTSPPNRGSNTLLRDGAHVILDARDALQILFEEGELAALEPPPPPRFDDARQRKVFDAIDVVDEAHEIAALTGLTASEVRAALGRLELRGLVRRGGAGHWTRALP